MIKSHVRREIKRFREFRFRDTDRKKEREILREKPRGTERQGQRDRKR